MKINDNNEQLMKMNNNIGSLWSLHIPFLLQCVNLSSFESIHKLNNLERAM